MNDQHDTGSDDVGAPAPDRSTGVKVLVFVFALPLLLVFLAEWLVF